jgi:hypothetical protein
MVDSKKKKLIFVNIFFFSNQRHINLSTAGCHHVPPSHLTAAAHLHSLSTVLHCVFSHLSTQCISYLFTISLRGHVMNTHSQFALDTAYPCGHVMLRWQHWVAFFSSEMVPTGHGTASLPEAHFIPTGHGMQGNDAVMTDVFGIHSPGLQSAIASVQYKLMSAAARIRIARTFEQKLISRRLPLRLAVAAAAGYSSYRTRPLATSATARGR